MQTDLDKLKRQQQLKEEANVKLLADLRAASDGFLSCVEMFLNNRQACGVPTDADFVAWITKRVQQVKHSKEQLLQKYEQTYPA